MRYLLKKPLNYDGKTCLPLWVVLHGAFDRPESVEGLFNKEAQSLGAFLLVPEASRDCGEGFCWSFARDAIQIHDLICTLNVQFTFAPSRLAIVGYSMGCTMGLWLLAQFPEMFTSFVALGMGSSFAAWEHDDGGINEMGLRHASTKTRILLAVDQNDPAGGGPTVADYFEENLRRFD